jgi:uncharacterized protein YbjT (DUF2867 family)
MDQPFHVVTGAFGYSGRYIARRLLDRGCRVRTLTSAVDAADVFAGRVEVMPYCFDDPQRLTDSLRGAVALYNTYWVRFNHRAFSHAEAVENTRRLFAAAARAGVARIVHVSITNPSEDSPLEYFRGKAIIERLLHETGIPSTILRPAVLFGQEDILINNIAWMLRHFPVFGVFGDGQYQLQPIFVDDLAELAVEQGTATGSRVIDAVGPETYTYRELVRTLGEIIGKRRPIVGVPPAVGYWIGRAVGRVMGDTLITREEIMGLMQNLLVTSSPPAARTKLSAWARTHADALGISYHSELARRNRRARRYS